VTDRGDGRVDTVDGRTAVTDGWRWSTDSGVEGDDDDGQTDEADGAGDEGLAKDGRGQRTVDADGRSTVEEHKDDNPVTKKLYIHSSTRRNSVNQRRANG